MSTNKKRIIPIAVTGFLLASLLVSVAIVAYVSGRNSIERNDTKVVVTDSPQSTTLSVESGDDSDASTGDHLGEAREKLEENQNPSAIDDGTEVIQADPPTVTPRPTESVATLVEREDLDLDETDLKLLFEVWTIVEREFDGELPSEAEITYGAIQGSLEQLNDQYSRFFTPDVAARIRDELQGGFEGIGAYVDLDEEGYLIITEVIEGQPAAMAGLLSGDLVTHVDGTSILGMTLDEMISKIKGPEGTSVTLIVRRQDADPIEVTIVRELIEIPIVTSETFEDQIAYVRLNSFGSNALNQLSLEVSQLLEGDPRALILDLRNNPGGFLSQAVSVADLFLGDGVVLFQRDSQGIEKTFRSIEGDLGETIPLVVLVSAGSASASEIVAGAIQDRQRGTIIGEQTLGKGSVQQSYTLSDGSELRVTIARWYTPNNKSINGEGITPDLVVETPDQFGGENDTQLQRAIQFILSEGG